MIIQVHFSKISTRKELPKPLRPCYHSIYSFSSRSNISIAHWKLVVCPGYQSVRQIQNNLDEIVPGLAAELSRAIFEIARTDIEDETTLEEKPMQADDPRANSRTKPQTSIPVVL